MKTKSVFYVVKRPPKRSFLNKTCFPARKPLCDFPPTDHTKTLFLIKGVRIFPFS